MTQCQRFPFLRTLDVKIVRGVRGDLWVGRSHSPARRVSGPPRVHMLGISAEVMTDGDGRHTDTRTVSRRDPESKSGYPNRVFANTTLPEQNSQSLFYVFHGPRIVHDLFTTDVNPKLSTLSGWVDRDRLSTRSARACLPR